MRNDPHTFPTRNTCMRRHEVTTGLSCRDRLIICVGGIGGASRFLLSHLLFFASLLTPYFSATAETEPDVYNRLMIRRGDANTLVPYEEVRVVPKEESLDIVGDHIFSESDRALLSANRSNAPVEHPMKLQQGADGVIIELRERPLAAVYAEIVEKQGGSGSRIAPLSTEDVQALDEQRARAIEQQDFVLNRLETLGGANGVGPQGMTQAPAARFHTAVNAVVLKNVSLQNIQSMIKDNPDLADRVKRVEPNKPVYANLDTSVALTKATEVWKMLSSDHVSLDGAGVRIGIVDTGVDYTHPDLGGCFGPGCKVAGGYDVANNDPDPMDDNGHGTHCAATAAGNGAYTDGNGVVTSVRGVAPGASVYAYKVLDRSGTGWRQQVIGGLERCADPNLDGDLSDHLDVCSLSLGGSGDPDDILSLAADATARAGVVVVIAAGNSGPMEGTVASPGTSRLAITVAATCKPNDTSSSCQHGAVARFSSRGPVPDFPDVQKPDIAAPGVNICAARFGSYAPGRECLGGSRISISGTSMATPHVAGVAALLKQAHPQARPDTIKNVIKYAATDLGLPYTAQGAGLVNAISALEVLGVPSSIARISGAPLLFDIAPTASISEASRVVAVTSLAKTPLEFIPTFISEHEGISAVVSPERITIAPGETVSFNVKVRVNLTNTPSGVTLQTRLNFATEDHVLGTNVYVLVGQRLSTNVSTIDLGVKNGLDLSWKDKFVLRLTNRLSDISTTYDVSTECCGLKNDLTSSGIRAFGGSSPIEIPPGGTVDLPITFEATGVDSGHGSYSGRVTLSSVGQTLTIPITLFKGWEFGLHYESDEFRPSYTSVEKGIYDWYYLVGLKKGERTAMRVQDPGPWQMVTSFASDRHDLAYVFKFNVSATDTITEVLFRESEASQWVRLQDRLPNGEPVTPKGNRPSGYRFVALRNTLGYYSCGHLQSPHDHSFRINGFTPNLEIMSSTYAYHDTTIFGWQKRVTGDGRLGDVVLGTAPFVTKYVSLPSSGSPGKDITIEPWSQIVNAGVRWTHDIVRVPSGQVATMHVSSNNLITPDSPLYHRSPSTVLVSRPIPNTDTSEGAHFKTTLKISAAGAFADIDRLRFFPRNFRTARDWLSVTLGVPAGYKDSINLGAGPEINVGTWYNFPDSYSWYAPRFGWGGMCRLTGGAFDDNDAPADRQIQHTLTRDGEPYYAGTSDVRSGLFFVFPPGSYQTKSQRQFQINGVSTQATTESSFKVNTPSENKENLTDQNPPSLENVMLIANGLIQNVIDPLEVNFLHFKIDPRTGLLSGFTGEGLRHNDPMPDELHSVALEQSTDGEVWTRLAIEEIAEGEYRAEIPVVSSARLYTFKISALDTAGNAFKYTFQMPMGQAFQIPIFTPTPTATPIPNAFFGTPNADKRVLLTPIISTRKTKIRWTLPPIESVDLSRERGMAMEWLKTQGFSLNDATGLVAASRWEANCTLNVGQGRQSRSVSAKPKLKTWRVINVGELPRRRKKFTFSYGCSFSMISPKSFTVPYERQSPVITRVLKMSAKR